jgi:glycosyltransferase involved in cell wall biosynthesis
VSELATIGVALCTYNGQRYVREQVESILAQTRMPDLVVVCDDASQDDTLALLRDGALDARVPFRIVRNDVNIGYVRNFAKAISLCHTDIIVLSDQDDRWRIDKLQRLEAAFREDPTSAGFFSDAEIVDENMNALGYGLLDALEVSDGDKALARSGALLPVLLRRNIVAGATLAFRSAWRDRILPIPEGAIHDEWIALVLAAYGVLRFVPQPLIQYRQHGSNQIGGRRRSFSWIARSLLRSRRTENERQLAVAQNLRERLSLADLPGSAKPSVHEKIAHLQRRSMLPQARIRRAPTIVAEVLSGRYARYSSGWRSLAQDLFC